MDSHKVSLGRTRHQNAALAMTARGVHLPGLVTRRLTCLAQAEGQEQLEAVKRKLEQMLALAATQ
jgi:hypothetical protein